MKNFIYKQYGFIFKHFTNFCTNQKPICDLLLVILFSHHFQVIADYW